jgi:hypothetical protein
MISTIIAMISTSINEEEAGEEKRPKKDARLEAEEADREACTRRSIRVSRRPNEKRIRNPNRYRSSTEPHHPYVK